MRLSSYDQYLITKQTSNRRPPNTSDFKQSFAFIHSLIHSFPCLLIPVLGHSSLSTPCSSENGAWKVPLPHDGAHTTTHPLGQQIQHHNSHMHIFGMWERNKITREKPPRHGENI